MLWNFVMHKGIIYINRDLIMQRHGIGNFAKASFAPFTQSSNKERESGQDPTT